jgi:putative transposase
MRKTYKYRLLGNKETFSKADEWLLLCQRLYNIALAQRIYIYRYNRQTISCYDQCKQLPELKESFPEYKLVGSQVLQDVIRRLEKGYKAFFRRVKTGDGKAGFPRFKSRDRYHSFTLTLTGWKLDGRYLLIRNMGRFKLRLSRPIEGNIKTVTIRRETSGHWYVCFSCDKVPERKLMPLIKTVGIDVGIKSFCVDSDGHREFNPAYFCHAQKLLRVRQRVLCRRVKNSNGRKLARILVAKAYEKVSNQRNDFLHKVANHYVTNYGVIYFEDLNISGMVKNHHLAKLINDASWGKFFEMLAYKAEEAGRQLIKVPRFEPTSKTCSECGAINQELTLNDRQWFCKSCGASHDRDYNAAKNIRGVGQTLQEQTYGTGQSVS